MKETWSSFGRRLSPASSVEETALVEAETEAESETDEAEADVVATNSVSRPTEGVRKWRMSPTLTQTAGFVSW